MPRPAHRPLRTPRPRQVLVSQQRPLRRIATRQAVADLLILRDILFADSLLWERAQPLFSFQESVSDRTDPAAAHTSPPQLMPPAGPARQFHFRQSPRYARLFGPGWPQTRREAASLHSR